MAEAILALDAHLTTAGNMRKILPIATETPPDLPAGDYGNVTDR